MAVTVLHVLGGGLVSGGNERTALNLIRTHIAKGLTPVLVALSHEQDLIAKEFLDLGIQVEVCLYDRRQPWRLVLTLARLTRKIKAETVLCYSFSVIHLWVHLAAILGGANQRITRVSSWPIDPRTYKKLKWLNFLGRWLCTTQVAVSNHVGQMLVELGGYPADRIMVIPNGCDVENINERSVSARGQSGTPRPTRVLMVARMDDSKDQDTLINAMAFVRQRLKGAHLWLVGDGPRRQLLETLANQQTLDQAIHFLGVRRDVPELLGQVDVFVLSTHVEGFPNALIEAMAAEIPVVASDIPPCREILQEGRLGALVPGNKADLLAEEICRLVEDEDHRQQMISKAKEVVQNRYNLETMAGSYKALMDRSSNFG